VSAAATTALGGRTAATPGPLAAPAPALVGVAP
ncbi:MAG: hypothetical protein AVDCRST_MAG35-549, partial [uncultured Quadrisphaera sp.]